MSIIVTPAVRPLPEQGGFIADGFLAAIRTDGDTDPLFGEFLKYRVFATESEACDAAFAEIPRETGGKSHR